MLLVMAVVSAFLHARLQMGHLPEVGSYGSVLAYSIALDGDFACVGTTTGLAILKIADPARIEKVATIDTLRDSGCAAVVGRHAYVNSSSEGLVVIDVSNRTAPVIVGRYRGRTRYSAVQVQGRLAYAVPDTGGLDIIDVSDPARPVLAGALSFSGIAGKVCLRGDIAYVSRVDGDVRIVDVADTRAPKVVSVITIDHPGALMAVLNAHLAVATPRGVCLYDLSTPRTPVLRKVLPGGQADICTNDGRTLFVHQRGVTTVFDLSNIESPKVLGTIGEYFHDLVRRGDLVFGVLTGLKVYRLGADLSQE